jgi:hypothetical protein
MGFNGIYSSGISVEYIVKYPPSPDETKMLYPPS